MNIRRFGIVVAVVVVLVALGVVMVISTSPPLAAKYYIFRGNILFRKSRYAEAATEYTKSLERLPHHAGLLDTRGFCYAEVKQYVKAIQDYNAALAERDVPDTLRTHIQYNRGQAYWGAKRYREALDDLRAVLDNPLSQSEESNNQLILANTEVAIILAASPDANLRDGDEAVRYATRALALCDTYLRTMALDTLAIAEARKGDYKAALGHELEAIAANQQPEYAGGYQKRLALFRAGKPYTIPEVTPK
jgi:tetratricopeptide (TPR) repeat protein